MQKTSSDPKPTPDHVRNTKFESVSFSPNGACADRPIPRSSEPHNRQQYIATGLDFDDTIII